MPEEINGTVIDSRTVLFGLFGDPVAHSKSPLMQNRAFRETGRNAAYAAFHIKPEHLGDAVKGIRALQFRGVNVTIPHKVEVMKYLDEIDEAAEAIGAVNTIVNDGGRLIGYNTDGIGYVRSLKEETGVDLKGKRILLLGAGGAARGIAYALAKEGAGRLTIANRTRERATELARAASEWTETRDIGLDSIADVIGDIDVVVNTTSIGMHPSVDEVPMDPSLFRPGMLASDLIYNPRITRFLREAEENGAKVHGGLGMFIYQGAYAFEYWTGVSAPVSAMREEVERSLGK